MCVCVCWGGGGGGGKCSHVYYINCFLSLSQFAPPSPSSLSLYPLPLSHPPTLHVSVVCWIQATFEFLPGAILLLILGVALMAYDIFKIFRFEHNARMDCT